MSTECKHPIKYCRRIKRFQEVDPDLGAGVQIVLYNCELCHCTLALVAIINGKVKRLKFVDI